MHVVAAHSSLIYLACIVFLSGCGTIRPSTWHNSNITDPELLERQRTIDDAHCSLVADGAASMPEYRVYTSQQHQVYQINANVITTTPYGTSTSRISGTVSGGPAPSFAQGFNEGYAMGSAIKARIHAKQLQTKSYIACMYKLGWSDAPPTRLEPGTLFNKPGAPGSEGMPCQKDGQCGMALLCRNNACTNTLKDVPPAPPYP